jgi:hypothetical protein
MEGGNGSWAASPDAASMSVAVGRHCSGAGILDRFWLEFSAVIPWLGGAESDEGIYDDVRNLSCAGEICGVARKGDSEAAIALTCSGLAMITRATNGASTRDTPMLLAVASITTSSLASRLLANPSSAVRVISMRPARRSLPSS